MTERLKKNHLHIEDINTFTFHQGSKFIVDTLRKKLGLTEEKFPYEIYEYGNTVSSSIPIVLEKHLSKSGHRRILISDFAVGLPNVSTVIQK